MRNKVTFVIGLLVAAALSFYAFTYTVRYDETAVETTFERATEDDLKDTPGIAFKWPWPVGKVYKYPRKVQVLEDVQQQFQTADQKSIIVATYVTWTIDNPYEFFRAVKDIDTARDRLQALTENLPAIISQHRFDELVNPDPALLKLEDIEDEATDDLRKRENDIGLGIKIEKVGIRRLQLPEAVSETVFAAMRSSRETLAKNAESEGTALADQITTEAESVKNRILAFAERTATAIRAEGQRDAVAQYDIFKEEPELAVFLKQIDTLKKVLPYRTTFILDANDLDVLNLLKGSSAE